MSVYDIPKEAVLRVLAPPLLHAQCVKCGLSKEKLPWQLSTANGTWGPLCNTCAHPLLVQVLRASLGSTFSENGFAEALLNMGVTRKEAGLLLASFLKDGRFDGFKGVRLGGEGLTMGRKARGRGKKFYRIIGLLEVLERNPTRPEIKSSGRVCQLYDRKCRWPDVSHLTCIFCAGKNTRRREHGPG